MKINRSLLTISFLGFFCFLLIQYGCNKNEDNNGLPPEADFIADQTSIDPSYYLHFTDQSTNNPTSWFWDFGDNTTSTYQNPIHIYNAVGIYSVSLIASNNYGSDTETKISYITVAFLTDSVTDYEGNVYTTVKIGSQWWMSENLKTKHYANGTPLVSGAGVGSIWNDFNTKYYFAYNDNKSNAEKYGYLYTWAAAMNGALGSDAYPSGVQGVCPDGWHLPSDSEWGFLFYYDDFTGTDDECGLKVLYAGTRSGVGWYEDMGSETSFWSSSEGGDFGGMVNLSNSYTGMAPGGSRKSNALSVRCVKD